jgi:hypothetical protein
VHRAVWWIVPRVDKLHLQTVLFTNGGPSRLAGEIIV